jgi:hypothetical protein
VRRATRDDSAVWRHDSGRITRWQQFGNSATASARRSYAGGASRPRGIEKMIDQLAPGREPPTSAAGSELAGDIGGTHSWVDTQL